MKHATPHIQSAQIGAIRYSPSKAPNFKLQSRRCVSTSRVASAVSAQHMIRNPVTLKFASPKDATVVPADMASTASATLRLGISTPLRKSAATTTHGVNALSI